jgi:prepilin-type N-terminal cleavage/methylation domain-containing protein
MKFYTNQMRKTKGFTLIELLVVIAIISLLSSVVLAALNDARAKARDARRLEDLRQINNALQIYLLSNAEAPPGRYRSTDNNVNGLFSAFSEILQTPLPLDPLNGKPIKGLDPSCFDETGGYLADPYNFTRSCTYRYFYARMDTAANECRINGGWVEGWDHCLDKKRYILDATFEKREKPGSQGTFLSLFGLSYTE